MCFNAAKTLRRERKFILADFYQLFYGKARMIFWEGGGGGGGVTLDISVVLKFLKCVLNLSYLRNLLDFLIYSPYNILCNKICAKYIKMLQQECDLFFFSIKTDCDFIKVDNKKLLLLVNFWSVYRKKRFISNRRLSKLEKWHSVKWFSQISWTNKFPASKYSFVGNYSTQKAPLQVDRIQPILV